MGFWHDYFSVRGGTRLSRDAFLLRSVALAPVGLLLFILGNQASARLSGAAAMPLPWVLVLASVPAAVALAFAKLNLAAKRAQDIGLPAAGTAVVCAVTPAVAGWAGGGSLGTVCAGAAFAGLALAPPNLFRGTR